MKVENWNGKKIRFVDVSGEWYAIGKDVATALGYTNTAKAVRDHVDSDDRTVNDSFTVNGTPPALINEFGIYSLVMSSKLPEAKEFKRWVFGIVKGLREASGLQSFEAFRMMDKEHQKKAMSVIAGFKKPTKINYIKANTIADKAVSIKYGLPKMVKKQDMSPNMLVDRQKLLDSTVRLMQTNDEFGLGLSVSDTVYKSIKT